MYYGGSWRYVRPESNDERRIRLLAAAAEDEAAAAKLRLEREKLLLKQQKLLVEQQELELERQKKKNNRVVDR